MKSLLLYFLEFSNNGSILPKVFSDNYTVGGSDQRPIIIITHNESIFSTNDSRQKIRTLDRYGILQLKGKRKRIIVSDFFLSWS